jgi:biotin/methionine sulfoxide reductase
LPPVRIFEPMRFVAREDHAGIEAALDDRT